MMDLSSVVDAAFVLLGVVATLMMGLSTLSADSVTVSTSRQASRTVRQDSQDPLELPEAA